MSGHWPDQSRRQYRMELIRDQQAWHELLALVPNAHVLQSWDWGEFKGRWGWQARRLAWPGEEDGPAAAAQVLIRAIPGTPWTFLYVPKGPALDYTSTALIESVLADLETFARRNRALFVKIDPDVPRRFGESQSQPLEPIGQVWLDHLGQRGWRFSPEQIQFRNTVIVDLRPDPEDILAAMKSKWRYNIRVAQRKGVTVRSGTAVDIGHFYRLYAETATRDGFLIRPEAYYQDVWRSFMDSNRADMLLAEVEGVIVAGLILFVFGQTAWYLYGASSGQQRRLMPNHLLQWRAICRAKSRGCHLYDLWGAPDGFSELDPMWGVYRFKQGFGGQVLQGLGAFDFPVNRPLYWAFTQGLPRLRRLLRLQRA